MEMYGEVKTIVTTAFMDSEEFGVRVGSISGSDLTFLFDYNTGKHEKFDSRTSMGDDFVLMTTMKRSNGKILKVEGRREGWGFEGTDTEHQMDDELCFCFVMFVAYWPINN
jgi:hypothetical protein